jgi:predicted  nucleic acid-binding Zn-ribbon protein
MLSPDEEINGHPPVGFNHPPSVDGEPLDNATGAMTGTFRACGDTSCQECGYRNIQYIHHQDGNALCYQCLEIAIRQDEREKIRARVKADEEQVAAKKKMIADEVAAGIQAVEEAKKRADKQAKQQEDALRNAINAEVQRILAQEKRQKEDEETVRRNAINAEVQRLLSGEKHKQAE